MQQAVDAGSRHPAITLETLPSSAHPTHTPRTPLARATGAHLEAMRVSRREGWEEVAAALPATEAAEAAAKATASLGVTWPVAGAGARMGAGAGAGVGAGGTTRA
jgi:hypothetical protein